LPASAATATARCQCIFETKSASKLTCAVGQSRSSSVGRLGTRTSPTGRAYRSRNFYAAGTTTWTLYWADRNSRWHRYGHIEPGAIDDLLLEIDEDPTCIFWG
jgi:hypothetical protein